MSIFDYIGRMFVGEEYYRCNRHSVSYPKGSICPKCDKEIQEKNKNKGNLHDNRSGNIT